MRKRLIPWPEIAQTLNVSLSGIKNACREVAQKDPETAKLLRDIGRKMMGIGAHKVNEARRALQEQDAAETPASKPPSLCTVPLRETTGDKPACAQSLSTPPAEDIETDGRGNIAKRGPVRVSIGAISVPDIRISAGHHA
jgi:hypothetical protein